VKRDELVEIAKDPELMFADGFDDAISGYFDNGKIKVVVYDREKCIDIIEGDEEYFEFNVEGAYVGLRTPIFVEFRW
jgi:hypothetical protein